MPEIDSGPIIAQGAVPVLAGDTEATLAARVLEVEHRIYPLALRLVAEGRVADGRRPLPDRRESGSPSIILIRRTHIHAPAADLCLRHSGKSVCNRGVDLLYRNNLGQKCDYAITRDDAGDRWVYAAFGAHRGRFFPPGCVRLCPIAGAGQMPGCPQPPPMQFLPIAMLDADSAAVASVPTAATPQPQAAARTAERTAW